MKRIIFKKETNIQENNSEVESYNDIATINKAIIRFKNNDNILFAHKINTIMRKKYPIIAELEDLAFKYNNSIKNFKESILKALENDKIGIMFNLSIKNKQFN